MGHCSVTNCRNSSKKGDGVVKGIKFHSFPKDPDVKKKWILATGKTDWSPSRHSSICSVHFREFDFNPTSQKRTLLKDAYPTINVSTTTEKLSTYPNKSVPSLNLLVNMDSCDEPSRRISDADPVSNAEREAIVYTTRLNDMDIFKTTFLTNKYADNFIDSIIKESKPKISLKRKRESYEEPHSHISYEDLTCCINKFKRITARNELLLSQCKPVKVVLENSTVLTKLVLQSSEIKNSISRSQEFDSNNVRGTSEKQLDKPSPTQTWSKEHTRRKTTRIVYDVQRNEADVYILDKNCVIKEYTRFQFNNKLNDKQMKVHRTIKAKSIPKSDCCCWYGRESFIKCLIKLPQATIRFMRKQHPCAFDHCRCCCRKGISVSHDTSLANATAMGTSSQAPSEAPSVWFNTITERHISVTPTDIRTRLIPKSLTVVPKSPQSNQLGEKKIPFLHSTNIHFGKELYGIGTDGQIKFFIINSEKDSLHLSTTADNVIGDICCWYKREHFAIRLLELGALPNTVNFIRCPHPCSLKECRCCCKPRASNKTILSLLPITARYTNDLVSKNIDIKTKFPKALVNIVRRNVTRAKDMSSFYLSLKVMNVLSSTKDVSLIEDVISSLIPENVTLDSHRVIPKDILKKNNMVRIIIDKANNFKTFIEVADLNTITKKELRMLDLIFSIIENSLAQHFRLPQINYNMIKPVRCIDKQKPKHRIPAPKVPLQRMAPKCIVKTVCPSLNETQSEQQTQNPKLLPPTVSILTKERKRRPGRPGIAKTLYPLSSNAEISLTTDLRYKRFLPCLREHVKKYKLPCVVDLSKIL